MDRCSVTSSASILPENAAALLCVRSLAVACSHLSEQIGSATAAVSAAEQSMRQERAALSAVVSTQMEEGDIHIEMNEKERDMTGSDVPVMTVTKETPRNEGIVPPRRRWLRQNLWAPTLTAGAIAVVSTATAQLQQTPVREFTSSEIFGTLRESSGGLRESTDGSSFVFLDAPPPRVR
eukprot:Hpha_TRINITY_DN3649_c0_g2::TRINITY_DN3649_c0_g2_i1::g.911::m.911